MSEFVDIRQGKHLGHQVVAKVSWRNLHRLSGFSKVVYILQFIEQIQLIDSETKIKLQKKQIL